MITNLSHLPQGSEWRKTLSEASGQDLHWGLSEYEADVYISRNFNSAQLPETKQNTYKNNNKKNT